VLAGRAIEAADKAAARRFMDSDPAVIAGVMTPRVANRPDTGRARRPTRAEITRLGEGPGCGIFGPRHRGSSELSANRPYRERWDPAVHPERRGGVPRRHSAGDAFHAWRQTVLTDRRLGPGRRWDDWRRQARSISRPGPAPRH